MSASRPGQHLAGRLPAGQFLALIALLTCCATVGAAAGVASRVEQGRYLVHAGGCLTCHTAEADGAAPLAGGRVLKTPFGVFRSPNVTPDRQTGIAGWTDADFSRALREGMSPAGGRYFPVFPYPSYTGLSDADVAAIAAYLRSIAPVRNRVSPHDLPWYLGGRSVMLGWNWRNFTPARFSPDTRRSREWNRGAYLVRHLGHCGECHTPRDFTGALIGSLELGGTANGPDGEPVPNITPHAGDGIGTWDENDIATFLAIGMLPDGDFTGSSMADVIDDNTSRLTDADRSAIAIYLKSLPPLATPPR